LTGNDLHERQNVAPLNSTRPNAQHVWKILKSMKPVFSISDILCHSTSMPQRSQCISRSSTFCVCKYVNRHLVWLLEWGISPLQILFLQWTKLIMKKCRHV